MRYCAIRRVIVAAAAAGISVRQSSGQAHEPDPLAKQAFGDVLKAYRDRDGIRIDSTVKVGLKIEGAQQDGQSIKLSGVYGKARRARLNIREYTCFLDTDRLAVTHDGSPNAYFSMQHDGSPYYALMSTFVDIPYPELAIMLGEEDVDNVIMQLHPKAPWIQPTGVKSILRDGVTLEQIAFTSDFDQLTMDVDRESKLIRQIDLTITGGDLVQSGATMTYHHEFTYPEIDNPVVAKELAFEPGSRQRVDTLVALMPRAAADAADEEHEGGVQAGDLVGKPAPAFVVLTLEGETIELADLRGKVVVLDFWATWCQPCRAALPLLHEVEEWRKDQNVNAVILTVNVWEVRDPQQDTPAQRDKQVKEYWAQQGFNLDVGMDYSDDMVKDYGVSGIPRTVVIGPDGVVRSDHTGLSKNYVESLKQAILDALLPQPEPDKPGAEDNAG